MTRFIEKMNKLSYITICYKTDLNNPHVPTIKNWKIDVAFSNNYEISEYFCENNMDFLNVKDREEFLKMKDRKEFDKYERITVRLLKQRVKDNMQNI